jgi:hypothetical protein
MTMQFDHKKYTSSLMESLSSQFDLDPSVCDNIDDREKLDKQIKFMQSRLSDVIDGTIKDYNSKDIYLTPEGISENEYLEEIFNMRGMFDKIKQSSNPKKILDSVKQKYLSLAKKVINENKAGKVLKAAMSDVSTLKNEIKKIDPTKTITEKKYEIMRIAKEFVRNKYNKNVIKEAINLDKKDEDKGSKAELIFNAILIVIFLYMGYQEIQSGDHGQLALTGLLLVWCLYDVVRNLVLLIKNRK